MPSRKSTPQRPAPQRRAAKPVEQLVAIARDLLPAAAGQARKNRPRLLAVCARIILSARRLKLNVDKQFIGGADGDDLDESLK